MKTWLVRFRLDDDGKEGGYFSRKEVIQMIKQIKLTTPSIVFYTLTGNAHRSMTTITTEYPSMMSRYILTKPKCFRSTRRVGPSQQKNG